MAENKKIAGLDEFLGLIEKSVTGANLQRVKKAYLFAMEAHEGQYRMSGEPYFEHPVETAKILAELHVDEDTIITGLLHDVPEDTHYKLSDVEERFGKHVATLVSALTKLSKVHYKYSMDERQIQSLQQMFLQSAQDVRVIVVKLADRLHNMSTLQYLRPEKQQRIAKETIEIYAPIANLFGIFQLRRQLEDLCFMYLQPEEYSRIQSFVHDHEKKRSHFVDATVKGLDKALKKSGINAELEGRSKHLYSIYEKMVRDQKVLQDIYDYFAIRIITDTDENCYKAMGLVHTLYKPKPGRIKDYIALPKPNGYQSLHTTVIGLHGKLTEIQIRTKEMHEHAEFGAAAHLMYKNKMPGDFIDKSLSLLKRYKDPGKFFESLRQDILQDRIYVFSPSGEAVNLPEGSSCLDYIFTTRLPVNTTTFRVLVNNKPYSSTGQLQSGDTVEVIYGKKERTGPERWWLEHVKTTIAKESIKSYFQHKSFEAKVKLGQELFQNELDHENHGLVYQLPKEKLDIVVEKFATKNFEELLAMIGDGTFNAVDVYNVMFPEMQVGFVNAIFQLLNKMKIRIFAREDLQKYRIKIAIQADDRTGLLLDLIAPFYEMKIPVLRIKATGFDVKQSTVGVMRLRGKKPKPNKYVSKVLFDVDVKDHEQLITLFDRLEKVPGMRNVKRVFRRYQASFISMLSLTGAFWIVHPYLVHFLMQANVPHVNQWLRVLIYAGLFALLMMMMWLKSMGDKTFPHFEETKMFWPLSYVMTFLAIITLFLEDAIFELDLQLPWMLLFSFVILAIVTWSFLSHERRRTRHLNRLKVQIRKRDGKDG